MSVQQAEQVSVFRIGVSGTSGRLDPVFVKHGKCFVCGTNASSANHRFRCIDAYINKPREAQEIFSCAGSYVQNPDGSARVYACHEHTNNLMELCGLVKANGDVITTSIVRKAMDGAWFVEKQITYLVRRRPEQERKYGDFVELISQQDSMDLVVDRMQLSEHKPIQAGQIMAWVRLMLAQRHNRAISSPEEGERDFLSGLEKTLQEVLDQQVSTANPR